MCLNRKVERHDKRSKEESSSRSHSPRPPRRRSVGQRDKSKGSSRSRSRSPGHRRKSSCSGSYTPASYRGLKRVKSRSRSSSSSDTSSQSQSSEDRKDRRRSRSRSPRSYRNTHRSVKAKVDGELFQPLVYNYIWGIIFKFGWL